MEIVRAHEKLQGMFEDYANKFPHKTYSQLKQEVFVSWILKEKRKGYFVEAGAGDGVTDSNTKTLEDSYGWNGILVEPSIETSMVCQSDRPYCRVEWVALWHKSHESLNFRATPIRELSVLTKLPEVDNLAEARRFGNEYIVPSLTLHDLLISAKAPNVIDYISLDMEGAELTVLRPFDFWRHRVSVWTIEHNGVIANRESIHSLMTLEGYVNMFPEITAYDDWYVSEEILNAW
jgi:hypothetical protein